MTLKEIKQSARVKLKGSYLLCASATLLYFIITLALTYLLQFITNNLPTHQFTAMIIEAIFFIISFALAFGITINTVNIADGKTKNISKFIDNSILNFTKFTKILFHIIINVFIPLVIFIFATFYFVGTIIAKGNNIQFLCFYPNLFYVAGLIFLASLLVLLYFIIRYAISPYMNISHPEYSSKEIVQNTKAIMKENTFKYISLILSFFPWILLFSLILFVLNRFIPISYLTPVVIILDSLLKPYITLSTLVFYESIDETTKKSKKKSKKEK